jgi:hypothetical protein
MPLPWIRLNFRDQQYSKDYNLSPFTKGIRNKSVRCWHSSLVWSIFHMSLINVSKTYVRLFSICPVLDVSVSMLQRISFGPFRMICIYTLARMICIHTRRIIMVHTTDCSHLKLVVCFFDPCPRPSTTALAIALFLCKPSVPGYDETLWYRSMLASAVAYEEEENSDHNNANGDSDDDS